MSDRYILLGCGGHARSIADVILNAFPSAKLFFLDENAREEESVMGFPVSRTMPEEGGKLVLAVGDNVSRRHQAFGKDVCTIVAKTATVSPFALLGKGCFVAHGAHIGPEAVIGCGTIINTNSIVEHEVNIGEFCHIAPNCVICGRCNIGNNTFIGAGAIIKDKISICSDTIIGAGAVIIKNITEPGIYIGCPARKKTRKLKQ